MPLYPFINPETGEEKDIFFAMTGEKKYTDEDGVEWKRSFITPQVNTVGSIDPWSSNDFISKTSTGKGNMGDLMDRSAELSAQRAEQHGGTDPVKKEYFKKYAKERNGSKHLDDPTRGKS